MDVDGWLDHVEAHQANLAAGYALTRAATVANLNFDKFPGVYFGGKSKAAPAVWAALGDVEHFVDPFCGSAAILLNRPHLANRAYYSETINDADGLLVNALRSIQFAPDATADAASWFVSEVDLQARHLALVRARPRITSRLRADPAWCDPTLAGWWLWGLSCWIGSGWCSGTGPWTETAGEVWKQPISRNTREPGVASQLPHLANDGRGVNRPQLREPGVNSKLPDLYNEGRGVNHAGMREPGVKSKLPHLSGNGQGVNHAGMREPGVAVVDLTMPQLARWFRHLAARLRHVRITQGPWQRVVTSSAADTLSSRNGGHVGIFLDPPYAIDTAGADGRTQSRTSGLYAIDDDTSGADHVAMQAVEWAIATARKPDRQHWRIVWAGMEGDSPGQILDQAGWQQIEWFTDGYLTGGMAQQGADGHQQGRERLWLSPSCIHGTPAEPELTLF